MKRCSSGGTGRRSVATGAVLALAAASSVVFAPAAVSAIGPDYTVQAGVTVSLCGSHTFGTLTIQAGGRLRVADAVSAAQTTPTGPDCPSAGDVNDLRILADRIINHGHIDANARQAEPFTPVSSCPESPSYAPATGNSGGPHPAPGGRGSTGDGGSPYDQCVGTPPPNGVFPELNEGAPGAGSGPGGRGGGRLLLVAYDEFVNDGEISADGEAGTGSTVGACAFDEMTPGGPIHHVNTGIVAPRGGGAGGSITVASRRLDFRGTSLSEFHANGGAGGNSRRGASGGGSGGIIWVTGPQVADSVPPVVNGGPAGTNLCAGDGESAGAEAGPGGNVAIRTFAVPTIATRASAGGPAGAPVATSPRSTAGSARPGR